MSDACFDDEILVDLAEGRGTMNASAEAHLGVCSNCRRAFAAVARGRGEVFREEPRLESLEGEEPGWDEIGHGVVVGARYVLDAFLGAGGMGIVWRALRADDGASVALKIARSGDLDSCRRFEREARVLAALDHPHIVRIYETLAPTENRGPVIVQELLSGESLAARLARVV